MSQNGELRTMMDELGNDPHKWIEVSERLDEFGNFLNEQVGGGSGEKFWESSSVLKGLTRVAAHIRETGHYCEFPDECTLTHAVGEAEHFDCVHDVEGRHK